MHTHLKLVFEPALYFSTLAAEQNCFKPVTL